MNFSEEKKRIDERNEYRYIEEGEVMVEKGSIMRIGEYEEVRGEEGEDVKIEDKRKKIVVKGLIEKNINYKKKKVVD